MTVKQNTVHCWDNNILKFLFLKKKNEKLFFPGVNHCLLSLFEFSLYPLLTLFITFHGFSIQFSVFELNEVINQVLVCPWRSFSASCFNANGLLWPSWHPGVHTGIYLWVSSCSLLPIPCVLFWFFSPTYLIVALRWFLRKVCGK